MGSGDKGDWNARKNNFLKSQFHLCVKSFFSIIQDIMRNRIIVSICIIIVIKTIFSASSSLLCSTFLAHVRTRPLLGCDERTTLSNRKNKDESNPIKEHLNSRMFRWQDLPAVKNEKIEIET
jgi:hypothetical protein